MAKRRVGSYASVSPELTEKQSNDIDITEYTKDKKDSIDYTFIDHSFNKRLANEMIQDTLARRVDPYISISEESTGKESTYDIGITEYDEDRKDSGNESAFIDKSFIHKMANEVKQDMAKRGHANNNSKSIFLDHSERQLS